MGKHCVSTFGDIDVRNGDQCPIDLLRLVSRLFCAFRPAKDATCSSNVSGMKLIIKSFGTMRWSNLCEIGERILDTRGLISSICFKGFGMDRKTERIQ